MMGSGRSSDEDASASPRTPLIPIGLTVLVVLTVPVFLFSVGPEGPVKAGDVVFSADRHRVQILDSPITGQSGLLSTCTLEPRVHLLVQRVEMPPNGSMIAKPLGSDIPGPPFCSPGRAVLVHPHQVTLRPDLWGSLRDMLSPFVSGR